MYNIVSHKMFFKVVSLTLVLLVQITYQGKLMRRRNVNIFNQSNDESIGHENCRKARQFGFFNKFFNNHHGIEGHQKSLFSEVMNYIVSTPDYGLKYTEDQPRRFDFLTFPGFHNLIEVRGPKRYPYVPKKLKEYPMAHIHKLKNHLKSPHFIIPDFFKLHPKKAYQLDEVSYSKEGFALWENSHESYKRSSGSASLKTTKQSTPLVKFHERRHYVTIPAVAAKTEVTPTTSYPNLRTQMFLSPEFFQKSDPFPFKEVKTRNEEPESDEDEEDERSKYLESY